MAEVSTHTSDEPNKKADVSYTSAWYHRYSIVLFVLFALFETLMLRTSFLWKIQELDLFSFNPSYWQETAQLTGWFLRYTGSFLTQLFYYPWLGTLFYILLLILIYWLVSIGFNLKKSLHPFAFIPALAVLLTITELGYEVLGLNVRGYAFVVPLGVMALMAGFIGYRRLNNHQLQSIYIFVWTLLAYPLIGAYALMSTLLMLLLSLRTWSLSKDKWAWMPLLIGLTSLILLPLLISFTFFSGDGSGGMYSALLPSFPANCAYLWLPYIVMAISLLVMVLTFPLHKASATFSLQRQSSFLLFAATMLMVHLCGYKEKTFYAELAIEKAYVSDDWQKVLQLSHGMENEMTEITASYTELSRHKLGLINKPTQVTASPFSGALLYYEYGEIEKTRRWCMNHAALYGMNVNALKYLALAAQATGNTGLALKYIQPLRGTLFYRKWALEQALLIEQSDITAIP